MWRFNVLCSYRLAREQKIRQYSGLADLPVGELEVLVVEGPEEPLEDGEEVHEVVPVADPVVPVGLLQPVPVGVGPQVGQRVLPPSRRRKRARGW